MKNILLIFLILYSINYIASKEERLLKLKERLSLMKQNKEENHKFYQDIDFWDLTEEELYFFRLLSKTSFVSFESINTIYLVKSMIVPKTDSFEIECPYTLFAFYDTSGKLLLIAEEKGKIFLPKDEIIYCEFLYFGFTKTFKATIESKNLKYNLPFDPINRIDPSNFDTSSISKDPLKPAEIKYQKRKGKYLYINSNNPEVLKGIDINKALIRKDISNKEVFFTFEHNTLELDVEVDALYTGFQIRNTGNFELIVKVKNIGFQYNGKGNFFGEKEWIDFYNMKFELLNKNKWTEAQKKNFEENLNFSGDYEPTLFETKTYVIPSEEYFYVIGGTTEDAYNHYNVFNTANIDIKNTIINGVVLFEVEGSAEGAYFIYNDISIPKTDTKSYQGYVSKRNNQNQVGAQYIGYDNCHGVVDNSMTWEFNDKSANQYLPVYYKVNYSDIFYPEGGKPYTKIKTSEHTIYSTNWTTHLNPNKFLSEKSTNETTKIRAIGNDMTKFITINEKGENIVIDNEHFDGRGNLSNIGNWMIDYIDNFNFVNRGDKARKINVLLGHGKSGSLACFVRNSRLEVIEGTPQYTVYIPNSGKKTNDAIKDIFNYTINIPSHSVVQIYLEYTLLANSYGNVTHAIYLSNSSNRLFLSPFVFAILFILF